MSAGHASPGSPRRGPAPRLRRGALAALAAGAAVSLGALSAPPHRADATPVGGTAGTAGPAMAAAAAATHPVLQIVGMSPTMATPGTDVRLTVEVANPTTTAILPRRVDVHVGPASALRTRKQVAAFAASDGRTADPVASSAPIVGTLAPRARVRVVVTVPARALPLDGAYGVLPLTVEMPGVAGAAGAPTASTTARGVTFLPFQVRKEYEPLSVAFAVPLTLDPDPDLSVATGAARDTAWTKAVGPSSRLSRLVAATSALPVAWAIDPAVTGSAPTGAATSATSGTVTTQQRQLLGRMRAASSGRDLWALPPGDPDLVALSGSASGLSLLTRWTSGATTLATDLGVLGLQRLAWPVGGTLSGDRVSAVDHAFGGTGPAAFLTPASSLDADPDVTGSASRRTRDGEAVIAYDDTLSRVFAQMGGSRTALRSLGTGSPPTSAEGTQRFLAETMTLLAESPGRRRAVLVAAPRDLDPQPDALGGLVSAVSAAPWLSIARSTDTVTLAHDPAAPQIQQWRPGTDPLSPGRSPLHQEDVDRLAGSVADVTGLAQVLPASDTGRGGLLPDDTTLRSLASNSWRSSPRGFAVADAAVTTRLEALTSGVGLDPSTGPVNFIADRGVLSITVVNDLDVEVHDVRLVVAPQGRPPRLVVTDPIPPLRISPHSRTRVQLRVEAIAAGVVPISTHVETPSGTRLGSDAPVRVRVQPANGWLMLAVGGLVGVVFLAGLYRALRAGSPRVSSEDLKEIDLE